MTGLQFKEWDQPMTSLADKERLPIEIVAMRVAKELPDMPLWQAKLDALKVGPEAPKAP